MFQEPAFLYFRLNNINFINYLQATLGVDSNAPMLLQFEVRQFRICLK
jgi:hypothetical protein